MAHFDRELTDVEWATVPLTKEVVRALDATSVKVLNGDGGGQWAPSSPIVIGGAGLTALGSVAITGGGGITTSAGKHITHGRLDDLDYITLAAGHALKSRSVPCNVGPVGGNYAQVLSDDGSPTQGISTRRPGVRFLSAPLRVHNRGTIASVDLVWMVVFGHAAIPANRPRFRVLRVDTSGTVLPLRVASDTDADGFILLGSSASLAAYEASAAAQVATYTVTETALATVDTSRFSYHAEIVEESGADAFTGGTGNRFNTLITHHTGIPHLGPQ